MSVVVRFSKGKEESKEEREREREREREHKKYRKQENCIYKEQENCIHVSKRHQWNGSAFICAIQIMSICQEFVLKIISMFNFIS